jgi:uncharacterized protein (DUF885 family)
MNSIFRRVAILTLFCLAALPARSESDDAKLAGFFKTYLDSYFQMRPLEATRLGDHRFDSKLEDLSADSRRRWLELNKAIQSRLPKAVDKKKLSPSSKIDYEILEHELATEEWLTKNTRPYEEDPRIYNGYINDSIYLLLTQSTLPKETNIANCIARMAVLPNIVEAAHQNLKNPPKVHTETAIRQNRGAIAFYQKDIFDFAGETAQHEALKAASSPVVALLMEYQKFLENELLPRANGEWRIGKAKFAKKLDLVLNSGMSAEEVLADAQNEFARVQRDLYVIARQAWSSYFPQAPLPPDDEAGRRDTIQKVLAAVAKDHCQPNEITAQMNQRVARLKSFISAKDILRLPEPDHCKVVEMPEFKRGNSTAYMEASPPLDPNGTGQLAVSPPPADWDQKKINSFLEEYNNHLLDVLTIHEGYPGHSVQLEYMNRVPSLIRKALQSGVYIEGWAVYTEQMMLDQGYGDRDLALRLSQLKFYLRAVANTILDYKMHCSNFSDEEALNFLMNDCFQSEGEARLKIIRSKQSSCQLSTYFVGRMAHYRLRQQMERELGDRFVLGRYHEAVLEPGAVPVKYLLELVRASLKSAG